MSPIGVNTASLRSTTQGPDNYGALARYGYNWMHNTWDSGTFSPFDIARITGKFFIKKILLTNIERRMHLEHEN